MNIKIAEPPPPQIFSEKKYLAGFKPDHWCQKKTK